MSTKPPKCKMDISSFDGDWETRNTRCSECQIVMCDVIAQMPADGREEQVWSHRCLKDYNRVTVTRGPACPDCGWVAGGPIPTEPASALDTQVGGDHYKKLGQYQPWQVLRAWLTDEEFRGYMKGTAIAYLAREQDKGGLQDIAKAEHTLEGLLEMLKNG